MNRWDLFETFVHVVACGSFTGAAKRLDVSTSQVSRQVAQLESHLGTQLLFRTTRRINPTDAGHDLFRKCEKLFHGLEEAEQAVLNREAVPRGHLRIVCTDVLGEQYIAMAAAQFCARHKHLKIDVHITMRMVDLVAEGYDLAIRYGKLVDSSLKARKIFELPHVVCASPEYLNRHGTPESVEDLQHHNCLVATFEPCTTWQFRAGRKNLKVDLEGNWRSNNGSALITAARQGIGICRLPELYVREYVRKGELVPLLNEYQSDPLPVWMVYPNTRYVPTKVRMFVEYVVENIDTWTSAEAESDRPSRMIA